MSNSDQKSRSIATENAELKTLVLKQSRLLRVHFCMLTLLVVCAAGGAATMLTSQNFDKVTAKRIEILDADNRVRIVLEAPDKTAGDANPKVGITLLDEFGYPTTGVLQFKESCGFWASRFGTDKSFALLMSNKESGGMHIANGGGGNFPINAVADARSASFDVRDPKTATSISEIKSENGSPSFSLFDTKRQKKVLFTLDKSENPVVRIQDEAIKELFAGPIRSNPKASVKSNQFFYEP